MKRQTDPSLILFWAAIIIFLNVTEMWLYVNMNRSSAFTQLATMFFVAAPLGWVWVMTDWVVTRQQRFRWQNWMWLVFVPWGFLWYMFGMEKPTPPKTGVGRNEKEVESLEIRKARAVGGL